MERVYTNYKLQNGYIVYSFVENGQTSYAYTALKVDGQTNPAAVNIMTKAKEYQAVSKEMPTILPDLPAGVPSLMTAPTVAAPVAEPRYAAHYREPDRKEKKAGKRFAWILAILIALGACGAGIYHLASNWGNNSAEVATDEDLEIEMTQELLDQKVAEVKETYKDIIKKTGLTESDIINAVNVANISSISKDQALFEATFGNKDGMAAIADANNTFSTLRDYQHQVYGVDRPTMGIKATGNWDHYKGTAFSNFYIDTKPNSTNSTYDKLVKFEENLVKYGEWNTKFGEEFDYEAADKHVQTCIALGYDIQHDDDGAGYLVSLEAPTIGKMAQHNNQVTGQYGDKTLNTVRPATSYDLDTIAEGGLVLNNIIPKINGCTVDKQLTK